MANNPPYPGGPGPPLRPMVGPVVPMPNIPPPMPPQFRPVAPVHPSHHFTPPSQQYPLLGPGIPPMNLGMPPSQSQQMQFAQSMQQAPARPLPPGHLPLMSQPVPLPNAPPNRPMPPGLPQPGQDLQMQSSFPPASGGLPAPIPPAYTPNAYTTQYQPVPQISLQNNSVSGPPLIAPANHGAPLFTPVQQTRQPSPSISTNSVADTEAKASEKSSSGWVEHIKNGRRYYHNKKTKQSTWDKPLELMSVAEIADATTDWKEYMSLDGRMYFYNKVTKQSKWLIPEELKLVRERAERESRTKEVPGDAHVLATASLPDVRTPYSAEYSVVNSTPVEVKPETALRNSPISSSPVLANLPSEERGVQTNAEEVGSPVENLSTTVSGSVDTNAATTETAVLSMNNSIAPSVPKAADSLQTDRRQDTEEANQSTSISEKIQGSTRDDKPVERPTPTYATKQEAKEAFKTLLESANVESDWTWEQSMRLIISDKRYGALKSLGERKQAFNEYVVHKRKQEADERRARNKKAKEDFRKMLEECSDLTSNSRWSKAVAMFSNDDRFYAIERVRDREDMFGEYLAELEEKERAKAEEDYIRNIMEYRKFLESCEFIKGNSQWRKVKDRLEADERCSRLETMDRLKLFQEYVGDLEKEEEEQRRIQKEEIRKAERRNRDEFRKLMDEHISDGTLTAKTNWREYHAKVKDVPAYLAVSSNSSGSTPKELFEDVAEELNKMFQEVRMQIKDALKSEKVSLSSTWTFEDFKATIANEISTPALSEYNLKLVFEELIERVREKEEKEAKRRKRLGDEFFNILCSLKDITVDSQWEDSLPFFEDREEFRAIEDEPFSRQIFEEYLVELKEKDKERKRKEEKVMREKEREREREKKARDRREKDRKRERDRAKDRFERDEEDVEVDVSGLSPSNENRKSGKDKEKKYRKRHQDDDDSSLDRSEKDRSRSSHRHSSERKKSRQMEQQADLPESDNDSKHKKHKRENHNGSRRKGNEELEDGELGNW